MWRTIFLVFLLVVPAASLQQRQRARRDFAAVSLRESNQPFLIREEPQCGNDDLRSPAEQSSSNEFLQVQKPKPGNVSPAWLDGLKSGLASGLAAGCVKTVLQPIDAIKTAQQYSRSTGLSGEKGLSFLQACQSIMSRPGGLGNFYAGWGVTVLGSMPSVALYFGVYSSVKNYLLNATKANSANNRYQRSLCVALAAAIGNSVASFSRVPYEVLKQQLQMKAYDNTWQALTSIAASPQRLQLIFPPGGIAIQMIRDVPYAVVTLLVYESLQARFSPKSTSTNTKLSPPPEKRLTRVNDFVLGGIAGGIGSWVTNPFDIIKTRLQTDVVGHGSVYGGSVVHCARAIWREGGAMAFLRGSVPRLIHKIPANAFFFLFYEVFRRLLGVQEEERTLSTTEAKPSTKTRDSD